MHIGFHGGSTTMDFGAGFDGGGGLPISAFGKSCFLHIVERSCFQVVIIRRLAFF